MARKIYILGHTDAVMITADVLTAHFGILRRCAATASEYRRCNGISPTLLCLLTQPVGMASKSTTAAKYIYDTLVMVSLGAWKMTFAGNTVYPCGSIDTNFDPP